jgi:hypothetical protein
MPNSTSSKKRKAASSAHAKVEAKPRVKANLKPAAKAKSKPVETWPRRISVVSSGLVDFVNVRGSLEIKVYATHAEAIAGGIEKGLADLVFKLGVCKGSCSTQDDWDPQKKKKTKVWCKDDSCTGVGNCQCHVIRFYKDSDGDWQEEDMGADHDDKDHAVPVDGTSVYRCRCQT